MLRPEVFLHPRGDGEGAALVVDGGVRQRAGEADAVPPDCSPDGAAQGAGVDQRGLGSGPGAFRPFLFAEETSALEIPVELLGQFHPDVFQHVVQAFVEGHVACLLRVSIHLCISSCHSRAIASASFRGISGLRWSSGGLLKGNSAPEKPFPAFWVAFRQCSDDRRPEAFRAGFRLKKCRIFRKMLGMFMFFCTFASRRGHNRCKQSAKLQNLRPGGIHFFSGLLNLCSFPLTNQCSSSLV